MAREQARNSREAQNTREKKHGSNPGTFSPDDDEAQEADITRAGEQPQGEQAQDRRGRRAQSVEQVEDEDDVEADDDEDEDESDTPQIP